MTEQLCDFPTCQLARQKGFDEQCRYLFMHDNGKLIKAISPPKDEELIENFRGLLVRYMNDLPKLLEMMGASSPKPLFNSRLMPGFVTRPTQDLLERWLREVHGLCIVIDYMQAEKFAWFCGIIPDCYEKGYQGQYTTFELAREAAIVHALKLLPDVQNKG